MVDSKGFTLVELIVAVAIVAILVAVAYPAYSNTFDKAEHSQLLANVEVYRKAAHAAITKNGYPDATVVWGDSQEEEGEWCEDQWIIHGIDNGILVTITDSGDVGISFEENSENYDKYVRITEKYGDIDNGA